MRTRLRPFTTDTRLRTFQSQRKPANPSRTAPPAAWGRLQRVVDTASTALSRIVRPCGVSLVRAIIVASFLGLTLGCATGPAVSDSPAASNGSEESEAQDGRQTETEEEREARQRETDDDPSGDPLISITGVSLRIQRTLPATVVFVPMDSPLHDYLRDEPGIVGTADVLQELPGNRFRFSFNVNTTEAPLFVHDRDRYLYPELFE